MSTILVVEDSMVMQRILSQTLRRNGYTVYSAMNGRLGLEQLKKRPVDLVITDYSMPTMNGLELLQNMRQNATLAAIPVIMLTASGEVEAHEEALTAGFDGFLTKPASSRQLIDAVKTLLRYI